MKTKTSVYWASTALVSLDFLAGGIANLTRPPMVIEGMAHLGYPAYFATILGFWKVLGAVALIAPRFPRVKEWAYAGIMFDLTSAAVSHAVVGDATGHVIAPLVFVALTLASSALRPESRTLKGRAFAVVSTTRATAASATA
jgi:uncharacterized membrane protein YphA (DoxX/SURF4 family)